MPIRVIFDLDGTLIDSGLDFDQMRRDMDFAPNQLILETFESLPEGVHKERCREVLREHEYRGAMSATLMPGAAELLGELNRRQIPQAILTRNSREMTELTLRRMQLAFSLSAPDRFFGPPQAEGTAGQARRRFKSFANRFRIKTISCGGSICERSAPSVQKSSRATLSNC